MKVEKEHYFEIAGRSNDQNFLIKVYKTPDEFWSEGKYQIQFDDGDSDGYMNLSTEELTHLRDAIDEVIKLNAK
ncbi:MAG TPA: hypothetical protein VIM65_17710 [Cyclobacteriaceae bacterium]